MCACACTHGVLKGQKGRPLRSWKVSLWGYSGNVKNVHFSTFQKPPKLRILGVPPPPVPSTPPPPPPPPFPEKGGPEEVSRESWGKSRDPPLPPFLGGPPPPIYGGCSLYQNRTQNVCPAGYPPSGVVHESAPLYKSVIFCQKMAKKRKVRIQVLD